MQSANPLSAASRRCLTTRRLVAACVLAWLQALAGQEACAAIVTLREATRIDERGVVTPVVLPAEAWLAKGAQPPVTLHLRLQAHLGTADHDLAIYLPGLQAHSRITLNGHVLEDQLDKARSPRPRSLRRMRWLRVPDAFIRPGDNEIEIQAAGNQALSISPLMIGPADEVEQAFDDRVLGAVIGPALVATIIASLALCVLVLWARRREETLYGYFGIGALGWGIHSGWSVLPTSPLQGVHHTVWWTALYSFFVCMLVIFCVRFAGRRWRHFDRAVWAFALLAPGVLYAADSFGALVSVTEAWLLACIGIVAVGLTGVSLHAWRHRDTTSLLLLAAAALSFSFGVRDWWVSHNGLDNNPVYLTPYAGLPFIVLAFWMLIDGFVRATRDLETLNTGLEERVARKSSDLRQALDDMRVARDAAQAANSAKSRFLAAASHDLRQPIHALGLYLGSIARDGTGSPARDTLQRMGESLTALQTMLGALLDVSRMDAGVVVPQVDAFDLTHVLRRLGDEFGPLAERKGLRLAIHGVPDSQGLQARSDPVLVERIMRNLLANAVQYTSSGGVLLSWRLRRGRGTMCCWLVEVRDTGCGIPESEQERVFDEFYRLGHEPCGGAMGLGLGLSIVRRLSHLLGVEVAMDSRPGRGTRFSLTLPATAAAARAMPAPEVDPLPPGRWVAVVEDDPDVRMAMRTLLSGWQCRFVEGATGAEVLGHWQSLGRPHVEAIVADFRLPQGHTGLEAIGQLQAGFGGRPVPALVVTGDATPERLRALTQSTLPWLSKPVPAARLRSWLSSALCQTSPCIPGEPA